MSQDMHQLIKDEATQLAETCDARAMEDFIVKWSTQQLGPTAIAELRRALGDSNPTISAALDELDGQVSGLELVEDEVEREITIEHSTPNPVAIEDESVREVAIREPDPEDPEWEDDPDDSNLRGVVETARQRMSRPPRNAGGNR